MKKKILSLFFICFLAMTSVNADCIDNDNDGVCLDVDCDDNDDRVFFLQDFYLDEDHDGFGTGDVIQTACWGNEWYHEYPLDERAFNNLDCNDLNSDVNPRASEICGNGIDENCDGSDGIRDFIRKIIQIVF